METLKTDAYLDSYKKEGTLHGQRLRWFEFEALPETKLARQATKERIDAYEDSRF